MSWRYKNKEIKDIADLPKDTIGFVYVIKNMNTDECYIGKKILLHKKTRPPLKGYKRKRVSYVDSNWKTYTGSNTETKKWDLEDCSREIVHLCFNRTMMSYYETKLQFQLNALEDDKFLNDNILGKFYEAKIDKYKQEAIIKETEC